MSDDKNPAETVELGDLSELPDGEMKVFEDVGEFGVVVCRVAGELYAVEDNCSHADTPLSEGRLRGAMLVCPLHGAQFDVRDGSHQGPPAWEGVACFALSAVDSIVSIDLAPPAVTDRDNSDVGSRLRSR